MRGLYGFEMNDSCETCSQKGKGFFCQLSKDTLKDLKR